MLQLQISASILVIVTAIAYYIYKNSKSQYYKHTANVTPVGPDFKWQDQPPLKIRPFVGKRNFNPKIGVRNISKTPNDWLLIENTYKKVTTLKANSLKSNPHQTMHIHQDTRSIKAVQELYDVLFEFCLKRYPQYFKVDAKAGMIENKISGLKFAKDPSKLDPHELLINIGSNIEEDFVLLLKNDLTAGEEEEYILRSSIVGFPAGFDPSDLFDKPISYIHTLVPQYESNLQNPMHKFFNNLKPTDLWVRHNWSIQTHGDYFTLNNHARKGDEVTKLSIDDIDFIDGCFLRCERQVLTRLPQSGAIVMTTRTYLTSLHQIKNEEGLGNELARGIDSLPQDMAYYKKRETWGEAVKEYLLTKEDVDGAPVN